MTKELKQKIEEVGKTIEPNFTISEDQEKYYEKITMYFSGTSTELDINKGLFVSGDVGTGKTLSMKIMQRMFGGFSIVSARHVVRDFLIEGMKIVDSYGRMSFLINQHGNIDYNKPKHVCFDDLLMEEVNSKFYGNQQNLMAEILQDRYDMFGRCKMKTYATSNANMKTLEDNYGTRVRDRVREMMNYVTLTGKTFRK